jgi:hypothetical protein
MNPRLWKARHDMGLPETHYFEIFQNGHRQYSPLYTEEVHTKAAAQPTADESVNEKQDTAVASFTHSYDRITGMRYIPLVLAFAEDGTKPAQNVTGGGQN